MEVPDEIMLNTQKKLLSNLNIVVGQDDGEIHIANVSNDEMIGNYSLVVTEQCVKTVMEWFLHNETSLVKYLAETEEGSTEMAICMIDDKEKIKKVQEILESKE